MVKETDLEILVDLRDFGTLITNKKFRNAICLYGWV
jgi:hypothetical protein